MTPLETLRYHVTGAIERGEAVAVTLEALEPAPARLAPLTYRLSMGLHCAFRDGAMVRSFPTERDARAFIRNPEA